VVAWLSILGLQAAVFVALPGIAGQDEEDEGKDPVVVSADWVIVRFRDVGVGLGRARAAAVGEELRWISPRSRVALAGGGGGLAAGEKVLGSLAVARIPAGTDPRRAVEAWRRRPEVLYAEPDLRMSLAVEPGPFRGQLPNDFGFGRQWALHNTGQTGGVPGADIGALEAWRVTTGSPGIVVAIVDTGVDFFHPDLEPNIWRNPREIPGNGVDDDGNGYIDDVRGYDFVSDDGDPMDDNVHGTHVAGILGAVGNDENGVAGVAWSVRIMALKAFDETGSGTLDDTLSAIAYARKSGARIINASWGTSTRSRALDELVAESVRAGVVFVAAAGNNGSDVRFFPAATPEAIAVGATDASDRSPTFSNYGSFVDLVAPGDAIESTIPGAAWTTLSGTSMAAPHVSGLVALLLSRRPDLTPSEVATILRSTTVDRVTDRYTGAGRIDAGRAVSIGGPLPESRLEVPATLSGILDLKGAARGNQFAGYRLEIGTGARPEQWQTLGAASEPDVAGVLVPGFDSARLDDGEYMLRLTVSNTLGQAAIDRVPVVLSNVQLSAPENNDVIRHGDVVEVRGTVFGAGRTYRMAWGFGPRPSFWEERGLVLTGGGGEPIVNGLLARWDTAQVPSGAFVTLRLQAFQGDRMVGEAQARMVHLESRLRAGWPKRLPFTDEFPAASWREFNVADLDGDGLQEIVLVDHGESGGRPPRLLVFKPDGGLKWSRDLPAGAPEHDAPVLGDLDGDGRLEVLVDTGGDGAISAFDADGRPLAGDWPVKPGGTHFGKVMADLDGDGREEVIALSQPPPDLLGARQFPLVVLDAGGKVRARWMVRGCDVETLVPERLPAVANLDDDPELEIVVVDGCGAISAFDLGKTDGPLWTALTEADLLASPVVGDLEGDGREEIIVPGVRREEGSGPGGLHVFDHRGQLRRGWPVLTGESFPGGAALADLNGDGRLEIVIASWDQDVVHVVGSDGFELSGWPTPAQFNAAVRSIPVIGDVDGDGAPDVVLPTQGSWFLVAVSGQTARAGGVRAWRADGSSIDFHPFAPMDGLAMESASGATWNRMPPALVTDLDGNGRLDVVAASIQDRSYWPDAPVARAKMRSTLYAWELPVTAAAPRPGGGGQWSAFQGGPRRNGRYERVIPPNVPPRILGIPNQTVAPGEAFRDIPLDLYAEDPDGRTDRLIWTARGGDNLRVTLEPNRVARAVVVSPTWVGRETIELGVRDPRGGEAVVVLTFEVRPGYRPPVALSDRVEAVEDEPVVLEPLANDSSPTGRPLRLGAISRPGSGVTEIVEGLRVRYRPSTNFFGSDRFEYTILDDDGGSATGEVRVEVAGRNDPPEPQPDRLLMDEDTPGEISLLENDLEVDGETLALESLQPPEVGVWEVLGADRYRYLPPTNYNGQQTLSYVVRDTSGLISTGEVSILVKPVNDPPAVRDQLLQVNRNRAVDVLYDTTDPDGDKLVYTVVDGPDHGVLLSYPELANYAPKAGYSGSDRFTYMASDGVSTVGPATVSLVVEARNNAPEVRGRATVTAQGQPLTLGLEVLDADGDPVRLGVGSQPGHGRVVLEGTNAVYTPDPEFVGEDVFRVFANDGAETGAAADVLIRVTDVNTAPLAVAEVLTVARNRASAVSLRASDPENNPLRFNVVSNTAFGRLSGDAPSLEYTPLPNFRGIDRFQFQATDGKLASEVVWVHLIVRDPNILPVTTNQTVSGPRDTPIGLRLDATDADGHSLQAVILKGPSSGRVHGTGLEYTYVPVSGFVGQDKFTYRVWDGLGYSTDATVTVEVRPPADIPLELTGARVVGAGFGFVIRSQPGWRIRVETSVDLVRWESVAVVVNGSGNDLWTGAAAGEGEVRFFRARREP
jgi:subtilisin family serine protease